MKLLRLLVLLLVAAACSPPAFAQRERILAFDSRITVNADSTIAGAGKNHSSISRGGHSPRHLRDFPTRYKDGAGNAYVVEFVILGVQRDGNTEAYHTERLSNGVRVYFGSSDTMLSPGRHTYDFTYQTSRQLGFFADHDELYWNVTGNGWKFPIDVAASASPGSSSGSGGGGSSGGGGGGGGGGGW